MKTSYLVSAAVKLALGILFVILKAEVVGICITLLGVALLLLLVWELAAWLHPERFDERTNECLSCAHCKEKLCHHKKQLRHFLRKNKERLVLKGNAVVEKVKNLKKK